MKRLFFVFLLCFTYLQSLVLSKLITLPRGVLVESVVHARGSNFFAADLINGDIFLVDINTNLVTTAARPGPNRTTVGIRATSTLLFAAGGGPFGPFGEALKGTGPGQTVPSLNVYEIPTGNIVATCPVPEGRLVNDVSISESDGFAYFTDSSLGSIYQLSLHALPDCQVSTIELPRLLFGFGASTANGIVAYRGGLLISHTARGALFFVDLRNENRVQRLVGDGIVPFADGLDLVKTAVGLELYVAQNVISQISVWRVTMRRRVVSLRFKKRIISEEFAIPTAVAVGAGRVVVPNTRLNEVIQNGSFVDISDMVFTLSVQER